MPAYIEWDLQEAARRQEPYSEAEVPLVPSSSFTVLAAESSPSGERVTEATGDGIDRSGRCVQPPPLCQQSKNVVLLLSASRIRLCMCCSS